MSLWTCCASAPLLFWWLLQGLLNGVNVYLVQGSVWLVFITTRPHCWKILSLGPCFFFWQSCSSACWCPALIVAEFLHGLDKPRDLS